MTKFKKDKIPLHFPFNGSILACGAEMKSAPCLLVDGNLLPSDDLGHMDEPDVYRAFLSRVQELLDFCEGGLDAVACDMHPDYAATRYAHTLSVPVYKVQHHHAHIVSCMADRRLTGRVVGIAADGTGYGTDGAIWGCEVLVCDEASFQRFAHLRYFALPGGNAAAVDTWRPAVGLISDAMGTDWFQSDQSGFLKNRIDAQFLEVAVKMACSSRTARTSSLGRLFDAAAFLTGLCDRNDTDAAAPIALQKAAESTDSAEEFEWTLNETETGCLEMDVRPMIRSMVRSAATGGTDVLSAARGFHMAVASMIAEAANRACRAEGLTRVVISGGCFFNSLLSKFLAEKLKQSGREVYNHERISPGDGGVAVGQAISCAFRRIREEV